MAGLVAAGKVRALGLSEVTIAQLDLARAIHPVAAVQSELSLWTRGPLDTVVPWCSAHRATFVAYAPLGRGYLTGTVRSADFRPDDIRSGNPRFTARAMARNQAILAVIEKVARRHDATLAQISIAWVLAQAGHIVAIPGTKRIRYLEENCQAAAIELAAADLADLDAVRPGHRRPLLAPGILKTAAAVHRSRRNAAGQRCGVLGRFLSALLSRLLYSSRSGGRSGAE